MSPPAHHPRRLNVARLAAEAGELEGLCHAADLPRLCADAPLVADEVVRWRLTGQSRPDPSGPPQTWLRVQATAPVLLRCQRCLQTMVLPLEVDRLIRFVDDEDEAEQLDEAGDDDVLAMPARGLDALTLVEDELIMALPLVPRHAQCTAGAPMADVSEADGQGTVGSGAATADEKRPNPFAVLAALKRPPPTDG